MVFYGVQYVPAKLRSTYNGAVFQWFMASGALFTGLGLGVILVDDVPGGTQNGLLGGALVAVSNAIILHLKRTLGLFTGVVFYQAANLITGYCVGRFGLLGAPLDPGKLPWLRDIGVVLLLISLQLVFGPRDQRGETRRSPRSFQVHLGDHLQATGATRACHVYALRPAHRGDGGGLCRL